MSAWKDFATIFGMIALGVASVHAIVLQRKLLKNEFLFPPAPTGQAADPDPVDNTIGSLLGL